MNCDKPPWVLILIEEASQRENGFLLFGARRQRALLTSAVT
jgi:hypothetical protein